MKVPTSLLFVLSCLISLLAAQPTTYTHNFNPALETLPSYKLNYLHAGSSVHINASTLSASNSFSILSLQVQLMTDTFPPTLVPCTSACLGVRCTVSCDIVASNFYRVQLSRPLTPHDNGGLNPNAIQPFQLTVESQGSLSAVWSPRTLLVKAT